MFLPPHSARRFIDGYSAVLYEMLSLSEKAPSGKVTRDLATARALEQDDPSKLEMALARLPMKGRLIDEDLLSAMRSRQVQRWLYLRSTTRHALFLDEQQEQAYAVLGLTSSIHDVIGSDGVYFKAAVFAFEGCYVCDGLIADPIFLGKNMLSEAKSALSLIKKSGRFHTKPAS